jgi:hypothetical protein
MSATPVGPVTQPDRTSGITRPQGPQDRRDRRDGRVLGNEPGVAHNSHIVDVEGARTSSARRSWVLPPGRINLDQLTTTLPGLGTAVCRVRGTTHQSTALVIVLVDGNTTTTTTVAVTFASTFVITGNCIDPGDIFNIHHHRRSTEA